MEPLISVRLADRRTVYAPGETLTAEYQVDAVDVDEISAIEVSVLWHTEGKGEEDLGVHFFERRSPTEDDVEGEDFRALHIFSTRLPNSPLSYDGLIVKIRWCVRVRLFLRRGRELTAEQRFQLGHLPSAAPLPRVTWEAQSAPTRGALE